MSSSVKLIIDKLDVELRFNKLGNELSFVFGAYFDAKKHIKKPSFLFKISY